MKTIEDYIKEYKFEELQGYYMFKNPCHYPICGMLFTISKIKPYNVYAATCIYATDHSIEYSGWKRIYNEEYEQYFTQMQHKFNTAIFRYKTYMIENKLSKIEQDFQ